MERAGWRVQAVAAEGVGAAVVAGSTVAVAVGAAVLAAAP